MTDELFEQYLSEVANSPVGRKRSGLAISADKKRNTLGYNSQGYRDTSTLPISQGESFSPDTRSIVDGVSVTNKNKILNTMTPTEQQQYISDVYDQRILTDEQGRKYQLPDHTGKRHYIKDQNIDTSYLYGGTSKTSPDVVKFGVGRYGVEPRYTPGQAHREGLSRNPRYGWESGPQGIDPKSAFMNWQLPSDVATKAEGRIHGSKGNIDARMMFDKGTPESAKQREAYGSGASEYYDAKTMGLLNAPSVDGSDNTIGPVVAKALTTTNPEEITKLYKDMTTQEKIDYNLEKYGGATGDGRFTSNIKGIVTTLAEKIGQGMDFGSEAMADLEEYLGTGTKKSRQATRDFWDVSREDLEKTVGLDKKFQKVSSRELTEAVNKGEYGKAALSVLKNLDIHLAQSAPEMVLLAGKLPGLFAAVATRVKADSDEYAKLHKDEQPDMQRKAQMWTTNAMVLGIEQFLVFKPIAELMKSMGGVAKGVTRGATGATSRTVGGKVGAVAKAGTFEAMQEIADQAQQTWNVKDKVITKNEAIAAGIAGGVMGGALRGAVEAPGVPVAAYHAHKEKMWEKQKADEAKAISPKDRDLVIVDAELLKTDIESGINDLEQKKVDIEKASTYEELEAIGGDDINVVMGTVHKESILEEFDENVHVKEAYKTRTIPILQKLLDSSDKNVRVFVDMLAKIYGLEEDLSSEEFINSVPNEGLVELSFLEGTSFDEILPGMELNYDDINIAHLEVMKKSLLGTDEFDGQIDKQINTFKGSLVEANKKLDIKKESIPTKQKTGKIDSAKTVKDDTLVMSAVKAILTGKLSKRRAYDKLVKYSDESLTEAYENSKTSLEVQKIIERIQKERQSALTKEGYDTETQDILITKDVVLSKNKSYNINMLKAMLRQGKFSYIEEAVEVQRLLDDAEVRKDITKAQKGVLEKRLAKVKANTTVTKKEFETVPEPEVKETKDPEVKTPKKEKVESVIIENIANDAGSSHSNLDNSNLEPVTEEDMNDEVLASFIDSMKKPLCN